LKLGRKVQMISGKVQMIKQVKTMIHLNCQLCGHGLRAHGMFKKEFAELSAREMSVMMASTGTARNYCLLTWCRDCDPEGYDKLWETRNQNPEMLQAKIDQLKNQDQLKERVENVQ